MEKEITIYDLAEKLSLSPSTVSRALNDHPAINEKTKEKVNQAAEEFGYQLNRFAKNLRTKSTNTIGVMVPKLDSYFMATVLAGMEKVANKAGYNLLITQSLESEKKEMANAVTMFNSRVDGLLISASFETETIAHLEPFFRKEIPTIFFDRILETERAPKVVIDNFQAGYDATKHLIEQNRKNIWHISGDLKRNVYFDRFRGYLKALEDAGLSFDEGKLFVNDLKLNQSLAVADRIHATEHKPDGLFVSNDTCAATIMVALKRFGYDVPKDISIIGFNNDPISEIVEPKLSTIHYPAEEMGEVAAQSLIDHFTGKSDIHETGNVTLHYELIVRDSSIKG